MINHGSLVISLDFEMMWGNIKEWTPQCYGTTNIEQVRCVIDRMLMLFSKYNVHATFATVGFLMHKSKEEAMANQPQMKPSYVDKDWSPYENGYFKSIDSRYEHMFFAPDVIKRLKESNGIEIGSHTYCHFYCWHQGQTTEQFDADLKKNIEIAKENGLLLTSLVFPQNNVSKEYLDVCRNNGITSYRGNAAKFFERPKGELHFMKLRTLRMIDTYFNLGGMSCVPYSAINTSIMPLNLRASRLIRPYSPKLRFLEGLRLRRIKKEMIYAAKHNEMYHIWWHPHNFGANIDKNMEILEAILECYDECNAKYGMQSYTMSEMTDLLLQNR